MTQRGINAYFSRDNQTCSQAKGNALLFRTPPPAPNKRAAEAPILTRPIKKRSRAINLTSNADKGSVTSDAKQSEPHEEERQHGSVPSAKKRYALEKLGADENLSNAKLKHVKDKFMWLHKNVKDAEGRHKTDPLYDGRTIQIPPAVWNGLSASQKAYWQIKQRYMDVILFYKVGTFYELYEEDAVIAESLLGWKMTISGVGGCQQVGTPERTVDDAIQRLRAQGYKVGRVEQMETAAQAKAARGPKATIRRELTNITSPTTIAGTQDQMAANHLLALYEEADLESANRMHIGFAFLDAGADHFYVGRLQDGYARTHLTTLLTQVAPAEVLFIRGGLSKATAQLLARPTLPTVLTGLSPGTEFPSPDGALSQLQTLECFGEGVPECVNRGGPLVAAALLALASHLKRLKVIDQLASTVAQVSPYEVFSGALRLDGPSLRNLELLQGSLSGAEGSLLARLDTCVTPGGRRLLRHWMCCPLTNASGIRRRQDAVATLLADADLSRHLRASLQGLPDLERLLGASRAALAPPSLALPPLLLDTAQRKRLTAVGSAAKAFQQAVAVLSDVHAQLNDDDSPSRNGSNSHAAPLLGECAAAGQGFGDEGRDVLELVDDSITWPQEEGSGSGRARSKPKKGREEGPALNPDLLADTPAATCEASTAADAADAVFKAEMELTNALLQQFHQHDRELEAVHSAVATLDVLLAFATFAVCAEGPVCRPTFVPHGSGSGGGAVLDLRQLWHPCAIATATTSVVANDLVLGSRHVAPRALLLTGPNMGGKSMLLRAACVAVIMAQMGCHVAAEHCTLSPADRIFTRIGASDNILAGESTFLVECLETSAILRDATSASMVVLDELGRGTSSCDGYSIAWAVLRHLSASVNPRMLFATHFSMLCDDFRGSPHLSMGHMAALVGGDAAGDGGEHSSSSSGITFLYKLQPGVCPSSYGLKVAHLAGMPPKILDRAEVASAQLACQLDGAFSINSSGTPAAVTSKSTVSASASGLSSDQLAILQRVPQTLQQHSVGMKQRMMVQLWRQCVELT